MQNKQNSSIKQTGFYPSDDEECFKKHLAELREAINLAETRHNVMAYYWAEERFAVLLCFIEESEPARYEERIILVDEILPTDWGFWMDILGNAWNMENVFDPVDRITH